jgi:hypothetical protein
MANWFDIVKLEVVPSSVAKGEFEIKVFYPDGSWHYFNRGFATRKDALKTCAKLMPKSKEAI